MTDVIKMETNGKLFAGWKTLKVTEAMEQLSAKFNVNFYDKEGVASSLIKAGNACRFYLINGENSSQYDIINGYIDSTSRSSTGKATSMTFSGRDKTGDLVDCSAVHASSTWTNARLTGIVRDLLEPYGLLVDDTEIEQTPIIEQFRLQTGESSFDAVERLCQYANILPLHTNDGNVKLTNTAPPSSTAVENLEHGRNLLSLTEDDNMSKRFSVYEVKGQSPAKGKKWSKANTQQAATAEDLLVPRYRPKVFMSETRATSAELQKRASWEAQIRAGRGLVYTAKVRGWFQKDANGRNVKPWILNERTNLLSTFWGIDTQRLITGVSRKLDESEGRVTLLTLKHPDTYAPDPSRKVELV